MIIDRFRTHPHLLEARQPIPTGERVRFLALSGANEFVIGEMPRGRSSFFINLCSLAAECIGIRWQVSDRAVDAPVAFADGAGDPLLPGFTDGTRVRVYWKARDFETLRVHALRWTAGADGPRSVSLPDVHTSAPDQEWAVPDEWIGRDPLELRLTPFRGGRQGLTESLILPPRKLRVETVFERVMLATRGERWRRLRVAIRVPPPLTPPRAIRIDWLPYDASVEPVSEVLEWAAGATTAELPLDRISLRGDRVRVRFEMPSGCEPSFAWFAADESGYGPKPPDVFLAEGGGEEYQQFEFVHVRAFPDGPRATILAATAPLPAVPALGGEADHPPSSRWPTTFLETFGEVAAAETWAELRRSFRATTADEREFERIPQFYLQYAGEPELRAITRRCGIAPAPFIVDQLRLAGHEAGPADREALVRFWFTATDPELDRWLAAAAAGANLDRLAVFWLGRKWTNPPHEILRAADQLEQNAAEPLGALTPEFVHGTMAFEEFRQAVEIENRLTTAGATLADFARASFLRETVLAALAAHWQSVLPADADSRLSRIAEWLVTRPQSAARELAALRGSPAPPELRRGPWPVFIAEVELATRAISARTARALRARAAGDWCRTLLDRRVLPEWPWLGLLPEGQTSADVLAIWEAVRSQLPPLPTDPLPPRPVLLGAIQEVAALAEELQDGPLKAVADAFRENCASLCVWIQ